MSTSAHFLRGLKIKRLGLVDSHFLSRSTTNATTVASTVIVCLDDLCDRYRVSLSYQREINSIFEFSIAKTRRVWRISEFLSINVIIHDDLFFFYNERRT